MNQPPHDRILAISCSTATASVALLSNNQIYQQHHHGTGQHSKTILPMIEQLLEQAHLEKQQLQGVAVDIGPGNFMGIRVAIAVATAIAMAQDIPLFPATSLHIMSANPDIAEHLKYPQQPILTAIDARKQQWYYAEWRHPECLSTHDYTTLQLIDPEQHPFPEQGLCIGDGWQMHEHLNQSSSLSADHPIHIGWAKHLLQLSQHPNQQTHWQPTPPIIPLYLRNQVANPAPQ